MGEYFWTEHVRCRLGFVQYSGAKLVSVPTSSSLSPQPLHMERVRTTGKICEQKETSSQRRTQYELRRWTRNIISDLLVIRKTKEKSNSKEIVKEQEERTNKKLGNKGS